MEYLKKFIRIVLGVCAFIIVFTLVLSALPFLVVGVGFILALFKLSSADLSAWLSIVGSLLKIAGLILGFVFARKAYLFVIRYRK